MSVVSVFNEISKQVYRLFDINTEEVSLVDRAANKRMFVMVKRNDGEVEVSPTPGGQFVLKDEFADDAELIEKSLIVSPMVQEKVLSDMTNVLRDLMDVGQIMKDGSQVSEKEVSDGIGKAVQGLSEIISSYGGAPSAAEKAGSDPGEDMESLAVAVDLLVQISAAIRDAEVTEEAGNGLPEEVLLAITQVGKILVSLTSPSEVASATILMNSTTKTVVGDSVRTDSIVGAVSENDIANAVRLLGVVGDRAEGMVAEVDKAGRKMSSGRSKRFRSALGTLLDILGEVSNSMEADAAESAKKSAPVRAKPVKKAESAESERNAKLEAEIDSLREGFEDQRVQLSKFLEAPNAPQGLPVQKGHSNTQEPFIWPRNMNEA